MKSRWLIVLGFLGTILLGAILLALPCANPLNEWRSFSDSLFTAWSAVCITGLTVVDPGTELTLFGQAVLLVLVELGCLGIMTLGTFFLVVTGQRISLGSEFSLKSALGTKGVKGIRALIVWVVSAVLAIESLGTVALWWLFTRAAPSFEAALHDIDAWYRAFFYSVMAFANAGFSLDSGSLAIFATSPAVLLVMAGEVILGGIGFFVIYNICTIRFWRRNLIARGRLSLHSQVVLIATAILLVFSFLFMYLVEQNHAFGGMPPLQKLAVALFQAVTPRTCGFTVVPMEEMYPVTTFVSEMLMFVGAASGGAGGGLKVTTLLVFFFTIAAIYRGRNETVMFRRSVPMAVVRESFVILFFMMSLVALSMTILLASEATTSELTFEHLLFETISAVTTTGLSCANTTELLSPVGRGVIMVCMLCGRLGAITVVLLIGARDENVGSSIKYPREELVVG